MKKQEISYYKLTLKFKDPTYEKAYIQNAHSHTLKIFDLYLIYMFISLLISLAKNLYFQNIFNILKVAIIWTLFIFLSLLFRKFGKIKKDCLDYGFCFQILLAYYFHWHFFFPPLLKQIPPVYIFYLASGIEAFRLFLYISRMEWWLVCITNILMNYCPYNLITKGNELLETSHIFAFIFPLILMNTLPFLLYFKERSIRDLFYQLITFDQSLKSFEELITRSLPNQIIIINDNRSKVLFCNDEAQKFFKSNDYQKLYDKLGQITVNNNGLFNVLEEDVFRKNTTFFNYQSSVNSQNSRDEPTFFDVKIGRIHWENQKAFLIILSDISAIKLCEKLKEIDLYKDQLLASVSHDLRTPLNGVVGILEILMENIKDAQMRKYLKIAVRCTNLLLFMVNDILDFSQINNGKLRLIPSKSTLYLMVKEVIDLVKFQCKKKNIQFILELPKYLKNLQIDCDSRRVQQVLLNLISNALKFTCQGYIKLKIEKQEENGRIFIMFSVEDSGIGIKEENISKLFKLFGKLQDTASLNKNGTGLGLVISQSIVEMLSENSKQKIKVSSSFGNGSTFSFKIPLNFGEDEEITDEIFETEQKIFESFKSYNFTVNSPNLILLDETNSLTSFSKYSSPLDLKKVLVLIVDDDQINLFVLSKYLESFGLRYITAFNGKNALEKVKEEPNFSLILMDCYMPIMNGFEATKTIKDTYRKKQIKEPIIVGLTASSANKDLDMCKQCGMQETWTKPISKKKMKEKLQEILKIRIFERDSQNSMMNKLGKEIFNQTKL